MQICGFKIKPGLIVTLLIIVAFKYQLAGLFLMATTVFAGTPNYCSFSRSLNAIAYNARAYDAAKEFSRSARLLQRDPVGIDLYQFGSEQLWIKHNSLAGICLCKAEQKADIYQINPSSVHPGDVVLDCGADVGVFTKKALQKNASAVIAIEPSPASILCLNRNFKDEIASGRVVVYPKGVWDKDDFLELDGDSFLVKKGGAKVQVPLTTIDKLVQELGLKRVDFIKMDIEGSEREALAGAAETIRRFHPKMAICVYHFPDDPSVIPGIIKGIDARYKQECGVCAEEENRISPHVYFFF